MQPDLIYQILSDSGVARWWVHWLRHDLRKPFYNHIATALPIVAADTRPALYLNNYLDDKPSEALILLHLRGW